MLPVARRGREKGITPPMQALMPDSRVMFPECGVQPIFRKIVVKSVA
jgi:hypothetical protein